MDRITVRDAYGHKLTLGIDTQIPSDILDMDEYDVPTWSEIQAMRDHVDELLTKPLPSMPGEDVAAWRVRNAAITTEAVSVMSAAAHYSKLRRGLDEIRHAARWGVSPAERTNYFGSF